MASIPDELIRNIFSIRAAVDGAYAARPKNEYDEEAKKTSDVVICDAAVTALMTANALLSIADGKGSNVYKNVAQRLKEVALLCFDAMEATSAYELSAAADAIFEEISFIEKFAEANRNEENKKRYAAEAETALQLRFDNVSDADRLKNEIRALRELIASLVVEREHLVNVEMKEIEQAYLRSFGMLEAELKKAERELLMLKQKLQMMQAAVNREEEIDEATIDIKVQADNKTFDDFLEYFLSKISEQVKQE
ncbi:MAG: hypothetical protein IJG50_06915 [Clostridia bacterium]|nr:hypothetical protein [Clostridia bacterium]